MTNVRLRADVHLQPAVHSNDGRAKSSFLVFLVHLALLLGVQYGLDRQEYCQL